MSKKLVIMCLKGETDTGEMLVKIVPQEMEKSELIQNFHKEQYLYTDDSEVRLIQYGEAVLHDSHDRHSNPIEILWDLMSGEGNIDFYDGVVEPIMRATLMMMRDHGSIAKSFVDEYADSLHEGVLTEKDFSKLRPEVQDYLRMSLGELIS